ncbi:MAG: hypothetical protein ACREBC_22950, partial [Pyrinomonadaceae bacterium]
MTELFRAHAEWFYTLSDRQVQSVRRSELDITVSHERLILSCWTDKGTRTWRIRSWEWTGDKLLLEASRRMGAERPVIELVPRASAKAIGATVKAARQARCDQLAQLVCNFQTGAKIERATLSPGIRRGQPGRFARILLRLKHERIAVTASVASSRASEVDAFLSGALLWFTRMGERVRPPFIQQLCLVVESETTKLLVRRIALLRDSFRTAIRIYEIDETWKELSVVVCPERDQLW